MISPFHGNRPPFRLASNIVYFHDWRYVHTGGYAWVGQGGESVPMWMLDPIPPMKYEWHEMPVGIHLEAVRAAKSEPVLLPDQINELALFGGTLIHEDGRYRLWYEAWPLEDFDKGNQMGLFNFLKYAESEDGVDWRLPSLGLLERDGSTANNIVYGRALSPVHGFHGGCVFKDVDAPPAERYKMFHLGRVAPEETEAFRRNRPDAIDPFHGADSGLFGGVSPDGLAWTPIAEPLVIQTSDTHNVCEYDPVLRKYVAYCRSWFFMRRTIGRMETEDFRRFPLPEELFWPGPRMAPYETWYANGKTRMPGTVDYHVMFPMRWSLTEDKFDFHLAVSPDNVVWNLAPGGPVCEPGDPGRWDGGLVAPGLGMVELPGERMGIQVAGSAVPHKHPRRPPLGALAWASWPKGRLVALKAPVEGSFALFPLTFAGRTMHLNFKTGLTGFVKVEVIGADGQPAEGRGFDQCDYLCGDHLSKIVTWKGESDIGHRDGDGVSFRFRLRGAELYSVEFK